MLVLVLVLMLVLMLLMLLMLVLSSLTSATKTLGVPVGELTSLILNEFLRFAGPPETAQDTNHRRRLEWG